MHEAFRRRLESLEEARKLRDGEPYMLSVVFYNTEATVARGRIAQGRDFECWRLEGESADDFQSRAHAECRAADPRPLQILIFFDDQKEVDHAA